MEDFKNLSVILGLFLTVINIAVWIVRGTKNAYKNKREKDETAEMVAKHDKDIVDSKDTINGVSEKMNTLFEVMKIQTRYSIVNSCLTAIERGHIENFELKSLEDMYEMYVKSLNGNSYATTLMKKVRKLEILNEE